VGDSDADEQTGGRAAAAMGKEDVRRLRQLATTNLLRELEHGADVAETASRVGAAATT
jgi:hypothetical protein